MGSFGVGFVNLRSPEGYTERGVLLAPVRVDPVGTTPQPVNFSGPSTSTVTSVSSSASSVSLLASNANRKGALIYNDSAQQLYIKFGTTASATSFTVLVGPGGLFQVPFPVYTGAIDGIWDSANGNARITELT